MPALHGTAGFPATVLNKSIRPDSDEEPAIAVLILGFKRTQFGHTRADQGGDMPSPPEPHPEDPHDDLSDQPASSTNPAPLPYFVVGLGASAGGLEALEQFFDRLPDDLGCAFVVIQHLSPEHKSLMAELLARHTRMPVSRVAEGVRPEPNHVYLNEASHNVVFEGGHLHMVDRPHAINFSIDLFFDSLARAQGPKAIAIVLSGTGSDGMRGIKSIKQAGGLVFVQEAGSARFDGMPRSALATGLADAVVPPGHMPSRSPAGPRSRPTMGTTRWASSSTCWAAPPPWTSRTTSAGPCCAASRGGSPPPAARRSPSTWTWRGSRPRSSTTSGATC